MFPYLFLSLAAFTLLNVYRQFAIPAFTPVLLNLSVVGMRFSRLMRSAGQGARVGR